MEQYPHLIDLDDYKKEDINRLLELAEDIRMNPEIYASRCRGRIMATLFYEPSTRTQMSFQTAMLRLGGSIIGFDNPSTSSVSKGESLKDTTKVVSSYADVVVMRNPWEGSTKAASMSMHCPVINAGDGGHLHPTQTLTDLLTLKLEKGRLVNLKVGFCGDLKNGRTVHSLLKALSNYGNNEFVLISTRELCVPDYIKDLLDSRGCKYTEVYDLESALDGLDMLYMTRIQKERFASEEEYFRQSSIYVLDTKKMAKAPKDMIVMHPLPRVDEITVDVDDDERAKYFIQAKNGVFVRMALVIFVIERRMKSCREQELIEIPDKVCYNSKCITRSEPTLRHLFEKNGDEVKCAYCDARQ